MLLTDDVKAHPRVRLFKVPADASAGRQDQYIEIFDTLECPLDASFFVPKGILLITVDGPDAIEHGENPWLDVGRRVDEFRALGDIPRPIKGHLWPSTEADLTTPFPIPTSAEHATDVEVEHGSGEWQWFATAMVSSVTARARNDEERVWAILDADHGHDHDQPGHCTWLHAEFMKLIDNVRNGRC